MDRLQQSAARRAAEAKATMPDFTASIGMESAVGEGELLHAVAAALRAVPAVNAAYRDGAAEPFERVGLAVALPGPVAPVVADADTLGADALAAALSERRARPPESFTAAELAGATFTVHGLGVAGLDALIPVLTPRQGAALGVGAASLTLVCDARVISVWEAGAFLEALRTTL